MTALRKIDASIFKKAVGTLPPLDCGQVPQLCWIDIDQLVVDPAYQRDIGGAGKIEGPGRDQSGGNCNSE